MEFIAKPEVEKKLHSYPETAKEKLIRIRELIIETASNVEGLNKLEETFKWGEPSYVTKHGSTLRMDWKAKNPEQVALYFQCTSNLVPTFRTIYKNHFLFEGNRALVLQLENEIPEEELKHCIALALTYHKVKHLPLLGA